MISLPSGTRIWLVAGVTDMRKSFNGLGEQVQHVLNDNPLRIFMKGDHSITAFFKVVVAFCNKITLCSLFFWIQVDF